MILRDPVHGLVSFETDEAAIVPALLETREVQRLRRIRQLGLTSLAYPGAEHSRFSHAIGAAFVMTRLLHRLRELDSELPFWQRVTTERARDAIAAALLHDLGHGPLSHLFEEALPEGPAHEEWTTRIVLDPASQVHQVLAQVDPASPMRIAELVRGRHRLTFLARAVSGMFDVDRCDYLLRDAHATGVSYGRYDLDWLIRSFRFGETRDDGSVPPLAIDGAKGLPAIESFILARLFMFQQVYFHKASRASEWMFARILGRARDLVADGTRVAAMPRAVESIALTGDASAQDYLALDDGVLWGAISEWRHVRDPVLSDLSARLYHRKLFKTYELYTVQREPAARAQALDLARSIAAAAGLDPDTYVGLDVASDVPFDDDEETFTVAFGSGKQRKPGDVSFLLERLRGQRVERIRLIFAPELRSDVVRALEA